MAEERTMHVDVTSEMIGKYVFCRAVLKERP